MFLKRKVIRTPSTTNHMCPVAAVALFACMIFILAFGPSILNPFDYGWLLRGDWAQHLVGWIAFANEPWSWPLGEIRRLAAPAGTSVVYTDSLPLLTLPLKLVAPYVSAPFQYQGAWFLVCVVLQGATGYLVAFAVTRDRVVSLLAAFLFVLWPPMYQRIGHDTLVAHWLLLLAIAGYFVSRPSNAFLVYCGLVFVAMAVHAYLLAMVLGLAAGRWGVHWWRLAEKCRDRQAGVPSAKLRNSAIGGILAPAAIVGGMVIWGYVLGYFVVPMGETSSGNPNIRYHTMNLNAFANPQAEYWSTVFPVLPLHGGGQYEGFQYLGAGVLFCVAVALIVSLWRERESGAEPNQDCRWALAVVAIGAFFVALSPEWTLGGYVLFDLPLPGSIERFLGVFRSLGRFGWVTGLVVVVLAIWALCARLPRAAVVSILGFSILLQLADLAQAPGQLRKRVGADPQTQKVYESVAQTWPDGISKVRIFPPNSIDRVSMFKIAYGAAINGASTNSMYLARYDSMKRSRERRTLKGTITQQAWEPDVMYAVEKRNNLACFVATDGTAGLVGDRNLLAVTGGSLVTDETAVPYWGGRSVRWRPHANPVETLRSCQAGCTFIIAVNDEASRNLPVGVRTVLKNKGGEKITQLGYRDSYLAVVHDGSVVAEVHEQHEAAEWSGYVDNRKISVVSVGAGKGIGRRGDIFVDGIGCSPNARGLNMLFWNDGSRIVNVAHADTFMD